MSWDPNQGQPAEPNPTPHTDYSTPDPSNLYGTPENPYNPPQIPYTAPQNPYGAPQNPYGAPQNPYGAPQNPYGAPENRFAAPQPNQNYGNGYNYQGDYMQPAPTPLPLGQALRQLPRQYLRVLTRPSAMTFAAEMGKAVWDIVWVQLIGYAIFATIISFIAIQIGLSLATLNTGTSTANTAMLGSIRSIEAGFSLGSIISVPIGFFIGMGILFGLAKAFHGEGRFVTQCYTFLLFYVPLGIIALIISLIPFAGSFIAFAISIFEIVLSIFAIQATHRLSGGRATAVVLIPVGVVLLLTCGLAVAIFAFLLSNAQQFH
jgi:hypothetical protein